MHRQLCLGTLPFGTTVDERTAFAILDRFVDGGGQLIDTANNYAFWVEGGTGDESELVIGRWLASRQARDRVRVATKCGARPQLPGGGLDDTEGLSGAAISSACEASLRRLGTDRVDLYWAHWEDRAVPLEQTVAALGALVGEGKVRELGLSNHRVWRVERARGLARSGGSADITAVQRRHSYLQPRPGAQLPEWAHQFVDDELLDYARAESISIYAYSPLIAGAYSRSDKPLNPAYEHPGTTRRLAALQEVAGELGATPNQVVLAWLMQGDPAIVPIVGASSVAQIEESLGALELHLDPELHARLDAAW